MFGKLLGPFLLLSLLGWQTATAQHLKPYEGEDGNTYQSVFFSGGKISRNLHKTKNLAWVAVNNGVITPDDLAYVCTLKSLKILELGWNPEGIIVEKGAMSSLAKAKSLEELTIVKSELRDEDFAGLRSLKNLKFIWIEGDQSWLRGADHLTTTGAGHLAKIASLEELEISNLKGALPDEFVAGLTNMPKLSSLKISSDAQWSEEDLTSLAKSFKLKKLSHFGDAAAIATIPGFASSPISSFPFTASPPNSRPARPWEGLMRSFPSPGKNRTPAFVSTSPSQNSTTPSTSPFGLKR